MRLVRDLGGMTLSEMEARMPHRELMEWIGLYRIENEERQEAHMDALLIQRSQNLGR